MMNLFSQLTYYINEEIFAKLRKNSVQLISFFCNDYGDLQFIIIALNEKPLWVIQSADIVYAA